MSARHTLSVIIIAMNEADRIRPCLESVAGLADEIIVFDSGSSDDTVAICREFTDQVFVTSKQLADIDEYLKLTANNQEIISKIIAALIQDGGTDSRQNDQKISA